MEDLWAVASGTRSGGSPTDTLGNLIRRVQRHHLPLVAPPPEPPLEPLLVALPPLVPPQFELQRRLLLVAPRPEPPPEPLLVEPLIVALS